MEGQQECRALPVVASNDPLARLATLFDDHFDRLYRLARRLSPNADDALDLVQETFLKAVRFIQSVPTGAREEEAWLVRVLINIRRDQWRRTSVGNRYAKTAMSIWESGGRDAEAELIVSNTVWQALDFLPPRRRAAVVMHELEGLSVGAIASLLGISEITVRWHLSTGKRDLRRALNGRMGKTNDQS